MTTTPGIRFNNIHLIVEAYREAKTQMPLVLVGDFSTSDFAMRIREMVSSSPRRSGIIFTGSIFNQPLLAMLRCHSAAYIHGHSVGGTNPSLLEAMSCGNLIIAHDNPFNREVVGEAALYFRSSGDLSQTLDRLNAKSSELEDLGRMAKLRAQQKYRWEDVVLAYDKLFGGT